MLKNNTVVWKSAAKPRIEEGSTTKLIKIVSFKDNDSEIKNK